MNDWNSELYLKFKAQRTQPAIDLAARISGSPKRIIDLGCGPANSTLVLKERFPDAKITGADSSDAMLETARKNAPELDFIKLDISGDLSQFRGSFDLVFSNACFQWIDNHKKLLPSVFDMPDIGGTLAVQIPMNYNEPIHRIIGEVSGREKWKKCPKRIFGTLTQSEYFDILSGLTSDFELWETTYYHRMPNVPAILEWYKSTGLRPYLNALSEAEQSEFIGEIAEELYRQYPAQENGEIIFKFPRFFFIAKKGG